MLLERWYNCGLSDTTLWISSSQSELKSPRKFRLLAFFFLYFLFSLLFMFTLTLLLTSSWLSLKGDRLRMSSLSVFSVPCEPETVCVNSFSSLLCFATPLDLENNENILTQRFWNKAVDSSTPRARLPVWPGRMVPTIARGGGWNKFEKPAVLVRILQVW